MATAQDFDGDFDVLEVPPMSAFTQVGDKFLISATDDSNATLEIHRGGVRVNQMVDVNPMLKGWFGYFKHAHPSIFGSIDGFVRRRLRAILRRHQRRRGRLGKSLEDHKRWPNAFFAELGLFTLSEAYAMASRSR